MILRNLSFSARTTSLVTSFLASTILFGTAVSGQFIDNAQNLPLQGNFDPMADTSMQDPFANEMSDFGGPQQHQDQMRSQGQMTAPEMQHSSGMHSNSMGSSTSASDKAAFASVYNLLAEVYSQREQTGMLYDSYSAQAQQAPQNLPPQDFTQTNSQIGDFNPNQFPQGSPPPNNGGFQNTPQQFPVNPVNTQNAGLDAELGFEDDFASLPDIGTEQDEQSGGFLSNVYLGVYGAGTYAKKSSTETASSVTYDSEPKFNYGGGGLLGYKLGPLRAELEGMYTQATLVTTNSSDLNSQADDVEDTVITIAGLANAYYKLDFGSFGAFGGGSVGYAQYKRTFGLAESTGKGITYGPLAGLTYKLSSNLELGAQYRYLLASKVEMTDDVTTVTETLDLSQHQAMLAVRFNF